jgi:hypothetical protein
MPGLTFASKHDESPGNAVVSGREYSSSEWDLRRTLKTECRFIPTTIQCGKLVKPSP